MADHAGFAAAVTVREKVLKTALLTAYANGSFPTVLAVDLPGGPPGVFADLFLGQPEINCDGGANLLLLTLPTWGTVKVTIAGVEHSVQINGELKVSFTPKFTTVANDLAVKLAPDSDDIIVRSWIVSIITVGVDPGIVSYLTGNEFKVRLQSTLRLAILFGQFELPTIDVSFFGPLARICTSVVGRVRPGVLLLGLNFGDDTNPLIGDVSQLADFALGNDVAGVVNAAAAALMLDDLYTQINTGVTAQGATLENFSVVPGPGYFQVSGAAAKSTGKVNFSFQVVPGMFHTRPGKYFTYLPKPRRVYSKTWPALEFRIENVQTNVDRAWWVVILEVLTGVLTLGFSVLYIEGMANSAASNFSGQLVGSGSKATARVQRTIAPPGGVAVRIGVDHFDVTTDGIFIGISVTEKVSAIKLIGPVSVPLTYSGDELLYLLQLPSAIYETDPGLRLRWKIVNRTNNVNLKDSDGLVAGRLKLSVLPSEWNTSDIGITAQIYRQLGTDITELGFASLNLKIRPALPQGAYIRWRSDVKNPQIGLDKSTEEWSYNGERLVNRWSEWHRTDAPCLAVNAGNRYRFNIEIMDRLPFSLRLLESHRHGLCPYCFFGGPAGINAML